MTVGSCFARHVGSALKEAGFNVIDAEPAPGGMTPEVAARFGYGVFSARYGNVYTLRQFRQLIEEVAGIFEPQDAVWEKDGRFFDALRPAVEPRGFANVDDLAEMRQRHHVAVAEALGQASVIVFTLGLTEAWEHRDSGTVYPTAPGTIAGQFDPEKYVFRNYSFAELEADFAAIQSYVAHLNPDIRWVLTVSPVPLTATASGRHVLEASAHSKATLRALAGQLTANNPSIDYFPAYELVTMADHGFADNLRSVRPERVGEIMQVFLRAHGATPDSKTEEQPTGFTETPGTNDDDLCEDLLLETFRP